MWYQTCALAKAQSNILESDTFSTLASAATANNSPTTELPASYCKAWTAVQKDMFDQVFLVFFEQQKLQKDT